MTIFAKNLNIDMNKGIILSLVLLIMGATATKAQFAQPDMLGFMVPGLS